MVTCQVLQELGYGLTREIVTDVIYHFLKDHGQPSPFTDGIPGPDWWQGFMHRWPTLAEHNHNTFLHFSHMSIDLIKRVRALAIHLFFLPPNNTHVLQPLDISVFGPMKQCWHRSRKYLLQHQI